MSNTKAVGRRRPVEIRRSWLFIPGADAAALAAAPESGADVLCQELEDFTPPERRPEAHALAIDLYDRWRANGAVAAVRINPFDDGGEIDLAAVMSGRPDAVFLPKTSEPEQIAVLDRAIAEHEAALGIDPGSTEICPNIESARGLMQTYAIAKASPRVTACLVASEDMAADLGAERSQDGTELAYVRARFHIECVAAGVVAVDCPYTWGDEAGLRTEALHARKLGYRAKGLVAPGHTGTINSIFTPTEIEISHAMAITQAFEDAQTKGAANVELNGNLIELPTYHTARRLLERARSFAEND